MWGGRDGAGQGRGWGSGGGGGRRGVPRGTFGRFLGSRGGTITIHRNDYKRFRNNWFVNPSLDCGAVCFDALAAEGPSLGNATSVAQRPLRDRLETHSKPFRRPWEVSREYLRGLLGNLKYIWGNILVQGAPQGTPPVTPRGISRGTPSGRPRGHHRRQYRGLNGGLLWGQTGGSYIT